MIILKCFIIHSHITQKYLKQHALIAVIHWQNIVVFMHASIYPLVQSSRAHIIIMFWAAFHLQNCFAWDLAVNGAIPLVFIFLLFFMRSVFIHCANGCSSVEHRFCNLLLLNVECYWYLVLQYCDERIKKCNELRNRHIKPIRFNRIRLICPYNSNNNFFYTMNRIIVFRDFSSCYEEFEKQSLFDICVDWCRPCNMHRHTIRSIGFVHSLLFLRLL